MFIELVYMRVTQEKSVGGTSGPTGLASICLLLVFTVSFVLWLMFGV